MGGLVEGRVLEADRKGLEPARGVAGSERRHRARVDPTRQEDAERHVAHEVLSDRRVERRAQRCDRLGLTDGPGAAELDVPVRLDLQAPVGVTEPVAGGQLPHRAQDRVRRGHVLVRQVARERGEVEAPVDPGVLDQGPELRREDELVGQHRVVEGLDPQAVARQDERARGLVPGGEGEHALEVRDGLDATVLEAVDDDLGVRARREGVPAGGEDPGELAVVVDLAVEDDPDPAVLARHRLVAGREVDDLEPAHREPRGPVHEEALVVGPAVGEPVVHAPQDGGVRAPVGAREDVPDDPAHGRYGSSSGPAVSRT